MAGTAADPIVIYAYILITKGAQVYCLEFGIGPAWRDQRRHPAADTPRLARARRMRAQLFSLRDVHTHSGAYVE
jgi:hypothetical protein